MTDIVIIGAGPVGLACAIEAKRRNLNSIIIDKGAVVNSFLGYPLRMEFFSTPELMEIGNHPFPTLNYKPTREEGIEYYRRVCSAEELDVRLYETVTRVDGTDGAYSVVTSKATYPCRKVIVATGFFDQPNFLDIPGGDLEKVIHYFKEPYPYSGQNVAVIGGKNSAAKAALQCYRHGAEVTLIVRESALGESVKYWLKPDLQNRIAEGSIKAYFDTNVEAIDHQSISIRMPDGAATLPNDWVLAMTGYRPNYEFLASAGIAIGDDEYLTPQHDAQSFETNRGGMYLAGTICGGLRTGKWFIENGRFHATQILDHIQHGKVSGHDFESTHWKTAE